MAPHPYQRRQLIVDRPYQLRFVAGLVMGVFAIAVLSSGVAVAVLWSNMYRPELGYRTDIVAACTGIAVTLAVQVLVAVPILFYLGIRETHRVVGPIARIQHVLAAIGRGDFTQRLVLRDGDVLQPLADAINQMADSLQTRGGPP